MTAVEPPLVEEHFDRAPADKHTDGDDERQREDFGRGQAEIPPVAPHEQVEFEESQGVAEPVPPQMHSPDGGDDWVDLVDVWSQH